MECENFSKNILESRGDPECMSTFIESKTPAQCRNRLKLVVRSQSNREMLRPLFGDACQQVTSLGLVREMILRKIEADEEERRAEAQVVRMKESVDASAAAWAQRFETVNEKFATNLTRALQDSQSQHVAVLKSSEKVHTTDLKTGLMDAYKEGIQSLHAFAMGHLEIMKGIAATPIKQSKEILWDGLVTPRGPAQRLNFSTPADKDPNESPLASTKSGNGYPHGFAQPPSPPKAPISSATLLSSSLETSALNKKTVAQLKEMLREKNLDENGKKAELVKRLQGKPKPDMK